MLLRTQIFTGRAVYFAGITPEPVLALERLLAEPDATRALAFALKHALLPGQLFALSGLYDSDPLAFQAALPHFQTLKTSVPTQHGCLGSYSPVPSVAKAIAQGRYSTRPR